MNAMLLAAGFGRRLFPLTGLTPKPVIPVLGRPLALQLLQWLRGAGVERVVMNLHHLPGVVTQRLNEWEGGDLPEVCLSFEKTILGTAGGVRNAEGLLLEGVAADDALIVANSDCLSDIDLQAVIEQHQRTEALVTLVLVPHRAPYSEVLVDRHARVRSLAGEPQVDEPTEVFMFTGCQVLDPRVLELIPKEGPSDLVRQVYRPLAAQQQVHAYIHSGFWWEFGSPTLYLEGSLALLERSIVSRRRITEHDPVRKVDQGFAALGAGAKYHPTASFRGRNALGFASHVSEQCEVSDCAIFPEAWVGPACKLHRCVVGSGVELPAGFTARDTLICTEIEGLPLNSPLLAEASVRRVDGMLLAPIRPMESVQGRASGSR